MTPTQPIRESSPLPSSARATTPAEAVRTAALYLEAARALVYRSYLSDLDTARVVPLEQAGCEHLGTNVRLLELTRIVYDKRENSLDELLNVYTALGSAGYGVVLLIHSDGSKTSLYLGVRAHGQERAASSGEKLLRQALVGQLPGTDHRKLYQDDIKAKLDLEPYCARHRNWALSALSGIPALKTDDRQAFTQGLERFLDAMAAKEYLAVVLAEPVAADTLLRIQAGYEGLATGLSFYRKQHVSLGVSETRSLSETVSRGFSDTMSQSLTLSQTHTEGGSESRNRGTSDTHTNNPAAVAAGVGAAGGAAVGALIGSVVPVVGTAVGGIVGGNIGGAIGGIVGGLMGSDSRGVNESTTTGTSWSEASGVSRTEGRSRSETEQKSTGESRSQGETRTISFEQHNKGVVRLEEKIEQQLKRIDEGRAYGVWNAACYFVAEDTESARIAASLYMGALRGKDSGVEDGGVVVWNSAAPDERARAAEYVANLLHPRLRLTGRDPSLNLPLVSPASLLTGRELALLAGLPRKSVGGVTVLDGTGFGREVRRLEMEEDTQPVAGPVLRLGRVRHLFKDYPSAVEFQADRLVYHSLVTGTTGTGKTTAMKNLLRQTYRDGVPFLVIEPAKTEYEILASLGTAEKPVRVYTVGRATGTPLRMNPLAFPQGTSLLEHLDRVGAMINAAFPMYAAMPQVLEEALVRVYEHSGWDLVTSRCVRQPGPIPTLSDVAALVPTVVKDLGYSDQLTGDYIGALAARLRSLCRGSLGLTFAIGQDEETNPQHLFDEPCVVNLSSVGSAEKKAMIMGLLVMRLYEHRVAQGIGGEEVLRHLTVLEEAHNLLKKTSGTHDMETANPQGQAVEMFSNSLAELRAYGEGFLVVDQSASALDVSVLRNTSTRMAFRAPFEDDRRILAGAMALNEHQEKVLARLENHTALIMQSDWQEAVLCHLDKGPATAATPTPSLGGTIFLENERGLRTAAVAALMRGRFPPETVLPETSFGADDIARWLEDQGASPEQIRSALSTDASGAFAEVKDVGLLLRRVLAFDNLCRQALRTATTSDGVLNYLVVTVADQTDFEDPLALNEICHTLLRSAETEAAHRLDDALVSRYEQISG